MQTISRNESSAEAVPSWVERPQVAGCLFGEKPVSWGRVRRFLWWGIVFVVCAQGAGRAAPRPDAGGDLDPAMVANAVRTRLGAIKACYDRALVKTPSLAGRLVAHWTIDVSGAVTTLGWDADTIGNPEMADCIQATIARWRFPPPSGGSVEVTFPFVFQTSGDPSAKPAPKRKTSAADTAPPERSRLALGQDTELELVSTLTGVDQIHAGQKPHLAIVRRKGQVARVLTLDFSSAKYPGLAEVIERSFFWTIQSSFVKLGSKRVARVGLLGRTGEDLMVLQEIAILVDVDGESPKLLWIGLGDREENQFDACMTKRLATFKLARPGVLERTWSSTMSLGRPEKGDGFGDYRRNCRAAPERQDTFPVAID